MLHYKFGAQRGARMVKYYLEYTSATISLMVQIKPFGSQEEKLTFSIFILTLFLCLYLKSFKTSFLCMDCGKDHSFP